MDSMDSMESMESMDSTDFTDSLNSINSMEIRRPPAGIISGGHPLESHPEANRITYFHI